MFQVIWSSLKHEREFIHLCDWKYSGIWLQVCFDPVAQETDTKDLFSPYFYSALCRAGFILDKVASWQLWALHSQ